MMNKFNLREEVERLIDFIETLEISRTEKMKLLGSVGNIINLTKYEALKNKKAL